MVGRTSEVHQSEVVLVGVLVDTSSPPENLFELGHGANWPVEHDEPTRLCIDPSGQKPGGCHEHRKLGLRIDEVAKLVLAFPIIAGYAHDVPSVLAHEVRVLVDERLAHSSCVLLVDTEEDCLLEPVAALLEELGHTL